MSAYERTAGVSDLDAKRRQRAGGASTRTREVRLQAASEIKPRATHWLWQDRLPLGSLCLIAGREGIGKSTFAYHLAAAITRGTLPGVYLGRPRAVIVAATEDSWAHTIVPRLMAAGADLALVFRVEVMSPTGFDAALSLPDDLDELEKVIRESDAALLLLDPLTSRLRADLDSHKDAEVRQALEPLVALADRAGATVVGLMHVNKSASTDALSSVMGSRAFTAVARAVLSIMLDPDDESIRLLGTTKNNLGRLDLPTLMFTIESQHVADSAEGPVTSGRLKWLGESGRSIRDALEVVHGTRQGTRNGGALLAASVWLGDYIRANGGEVDSAQAKADAEAAGHSAATIGRARQALRVTSASSGFPRTTVWRMPDDDAVGSDPAGESVVDSTGSDYAVESVSSSQIKESAPDAADPTVDFETMIHHANIAARLRSSRPHPGPESPRRASG